MTQLTTNEETAERKSQEPTYNVPDLALALVVLRGELTMEQSEKHYGECLMEIVNDLRGKTKTGRAVTQCKAYVTPSQVGRLFDIATGEMASRRFHDLGRENTDVYRLELREFLRRGVYEQKGCKDVLEGFGVSGIWEYLDQHQRSSL